MIFEIGTIHHWTCFNRAPFNHSDTENVQYSDLHCLLIKCFVKVHTLMIHMARYNYEVASSSDDEDVNNPELQLSQDTVSALIYSRFSIHSRIGCSVGFGLVSRDYLASALSIY